MNQTSTASKVLRLQLRSRNQRARLGPQRAITAIAAAAVAVPVVVVDARFFYEAEMKRPGYSPGLFVRNHQNSFLP
jgi:hypothetical protein